MERVNVQFSMQIRIGIEFHNVNIEECRGTSRGILLCYKDFFSSFDSGSVKVNVVPAPSVLTTSIFSL